MINELEGEHRRSYIRYGAHALAQKDDTECVLLSTDSQGSVIQATSRKGQARVAYTPYGGRPLDDGMSSLLGFNGELPDPYTGCYLLGNGYRAYNPLLMRFHTPDSLSVFDGGGLNPYAYCLGDPINYRDPTGHITAVQGVKIGLAIGLSVASLALTIFTFGAAAPTVGLSVTSIISLVYEVVSTAISITSAVLDELAPDSTVTQVLGYAGIAFGLISGGIGPSVNSRIKASVKHWKKRLTALEKRLLDNQPGLEPKSLRHQGRCQLPVHYCAPMEVLKT